MEAGIRKTGANLKIFIQTKGHPLAKIQQAIMQEIWHTMKTGYKVFYIEKCHYPNFSYPYHGWKKASIQNKAENLLYGFHGKDRRKV